MMYQLVLPTTPLQAEPLAEAVDKFPSPPPLAISWYEKDGAWRVEALYDGTTPDMQALAAHILALTSHTLDVAAAQLEQVEQRDWVAETQRSLHPIHAGRFFVHGSYDRHKAPAGATAIEINAGQAFGTGHHATTAGCLTALDNVLKNRTIRNPFDLGCGTAVLAIAAAKALKRPVLASDIDPIAVGVAHQNARNNGVAGLVRAVTASGFNHPLIGHTAPYDLILANILANPLMALADEMRQHMQSGGTAILSGILTHQAQQVAARYRSADFVMERTRSIAEWTVLVIKAA